MAKKLFVGNLNWGITDAELREIFSAFGEIAPDAEKEKGAQVITDRFSGRSKGFGFVTFVNDEDADKAVAEMNNKDVKGRNIVVNEARPLEERPPRYQNRRAA